MDQSNEILRRSEELDRLAAQVLGALPPVTLLPDAAARIRSAVVAEARRIRPAALIRPAWMQAVAAAAAALGIAMVLPKSADSFSRQRSADMAVDPSDSLAVWLAAAEDSGDRVAQLYEGAADPSQTDDDPADDDTILEGLDESFQSIWGA